MKHTIINKHVLDALKELPDESVDCIVTSPPYYGLRTYTGSETIWGGDSNCEHECDAWKGQLGLEPTYQMYLDHLLMVTAELKRVLKPSGTMFWNMGDSYASSGGPSRHKGYADPKYPKGRNGEFAEPTSYDQGISAKSLMMIPERFAIRLIDEQGFILRNSIIWYKKNSLPSSVKDRFSNKYEFIWFFVKNKHYYFNLDSVRKKLANSTIQRISQHNIPNQFQHGKVAEFGGVTQNMNIKNILTNMHNKYEEHDGEHTQKYYGYFNENISDNDTNSKDVLGYNSKYNEGKYGQPMQGFIRNKSIEQERLQSRHDATILFPGDLKAQQEYINYIHDHAGNLNGANPGDVFKINTKPFSGAHFAVYPDTLVRPLLRAGCPPNGVVLDPFAGSGTTGMVAKELELSSILIEIVPEYVEIIKKRMNWGTGFNIEWQLLK
ncbi:MAG: site-specific DNA-methyltransferase [Nitrososphaeria archaeon]